MLAEIAAASAAYSTIKKAISQGRELVDVGKSIGAFVSAEEDLKAKVEKKKNSVFTKVLGKEGDDFEEFLALDKLKEQKRSLESHMRLFGRAGLYDDWVAYQAQMRRQRKEALKKKQKEAEELKELLTWAFIIIFVWGGIGYGIYWWFTK
jgi:type I site-specific restriction-modification system R (restriction) subunit